MVDLVAATSPVGSGALRRGMIVSVLGLTACSSTPEASSTAIGSVSAVASADPSPSSPDAAATTGSSRRDGAQHAVQRRAIVRRPDRFDRFDRFGGLAGLEGSSVTIKITYGGTFHVAAPK